MTSVRIALAALMPYADKEQLRKYQREWARKRREKYMGGKPCAWCGEHSDKMNLHHRDPTQKVTHRIWNWKEERILEELAKCDIICEDCHIEHHAAEKRYSEKDYKHGLVTTYDHYGCRCEKCYNAKSEKNRRYRESLRP